MVLHPMARPYPNKRINAQVEPHQTIIASHYTHHRSYAYLQNAQVHDLTDPPLSLLSIIPFYRYRSPRQRQHGPMREQQEKVGSLSSLLMMKNDGRFL